MDQGEATLKIFHDDSIREFYANYVGIKNQDQLVCHWQTIRSRLSEHGPRYKCINYYKFVEPRLSYRFYYRSLVDMKNLGDQAPIIIDLGCCTGTDLRKLMLDGYPGNKLYGIDINQHYIDTGYDLFLDQDHCPITFLVGDIFTTPIPSYLHQRVGVIYTGSVIHLFSLTQFHTLMALITTQFLLPNGLFMGTQVVADATTSMTRRGNTKHFIGMQDFKEALERHHFVDIELCKEPEPRQKDPDEDVDLNTYWLSFRCRLGTSTNTSTSIVDVHDDDNKVDE